MGTITQRRAFLPPLGESRPPSLGLRMGLRAVLLRMVDCVLTWQERASQRTALASLEDHMLKDIGLSRADVAREASRPFWRT